MSLKPILADLASANAQGVYFTPLPHLQVIRFSGADALTFLHGQVTHDVLGMPADQGRLAAYCSAKGRMLASMVMWHGQDEAGQACVLAIVHASVAEALIKRLRMFVLRAKVQIAQMQASVSGVWAESAGAQQALADRVGELAAQAWQRTESGDDVWIAAPRAANGPAARWWHIAPGSAPAAEAQAEAVEAWGAQDIEAGLAWVTAPLQDLVNPLVANFDLIEGVSFTKGCYPGQEVVARSHYLGKQKRRGLIARLSPDAGTNAVDAVGADVYQAGSAGEPLGRVINAASTPDGLRVMFEAPVAVAQSVEVRLGAPDGPALTLIDLPYSLAAQA